METLRKISMTQRDETRLKALISSDRSNEGKILGLLLDNATIVSSEEISGDTITMNSRIRLREVDSGDEFEVDLLFPHDVTKNQESISILSPEGVALFGLSEGELASWRSPDGKVNKFKILSVLWQPEAAGLFQF